MKPVALVTGSSRGIGRAIAFSLAARGFRVILHGRTESAHLDAATQDIRDKKGIAEQIVFDLHDISRNSHHVDRVFEIFGAVHCLVNNAGISVKTRGDLLDIEEDSMDDQYYVNMRGTFFLTQAVARKMISQDKKIFNSIINITSSNATAASIERGEYCMAKSALSMMSKLFAIRLADDGINVYEIRPGLIRTDMTKVVAEKYNQKILHGFTPINRWGEATDIGEAIVPIAEGAFRFVTGDIFHIDGGLVLRHY